MSALHLVLSCPTDSLCANDCALPIEVQTWHCACAEPGLCVVQPWQIAMEKTQLASQEVASANMAAESAAAALRKAEQAEQVVEREGREHNRVRPACLPDI